MDELDKYKTAWNEKSSEISMSISEEKIIKVVERKSSSLLGKFTDSIRKEIILGVFAYPILFVVAYFSKSLLLFIVLFALLPISVVFYSYAIKKIKKLVADRTNHTNLLSYLNFLVPIIGNAIKNYKILNFIMAPILCLIFVMPSYYIGFEFGAGLAGADAEEIARLAEKMQNKIDENMITLSITFIIMTLVTIYITNLLINALYTKH